MNPAVELALGRIFRLLARPAQPGDVADYERCRALVLDALDPDRAGLPDPAPNYARDHRRGAAGD